MKLQDKLQALKKEFEASAPKEALEVMNQATRDLMSSDIVEHIRKTGQQAPAFTLSDASGQPVSSTELLAKGPLVIMFYRGAW